ncbi:MAG TPA: hypothetical protein DHU63_04295 [Candidatus Marinimicrobia bacterium]|nr:MAG: hypothetical protein AUJ47_09100 [Candidatus Marinimicrobia bacterium CG1_02_48_14]PJA54554.1 MAG: hypothetical protein CO167_03210 [Candidatus Marinimicrobia bacterium CG_4_9_14_3_um_filter_48_9]HCW75741.1 hypothetical protein [Candidatus Neomarinimicrobiota bacterium]
MDSKIVSTLKSLGFTANESKAYLTLLRANPATGYEISGKSGVPRSAIYEILKRLETMGLVSVTDANPTRYIPLPPQQLFELLEHRFSTDLDELKSTLKAINTTMEVGDLWNIVGYENMIQRGRSMIQSAERTIYLSAWRPEYDLFKTDLQDAVERGVHVMIFSFTEIPQDIGLVFSYNLKTAELEKIWSKKILMVVDKETALLGGSDQTPGIKVAWTKNYAIVSIALNYIILDLTLLAQRFNVHLGSIVADMLEGDIRSLDDLFGENHVPTFPPGLDSA